MVLPELEMRVLDQEFLVLLNPPLLEEVKMAPVPMTDMLMYPLRLKVSRPPPPSILPVPCKSHSLLSEIRRMCLSLV